MRGPRRPVESSIATFLLGGLMFSPPILVIFGAEASIFGLPLLYLYVFAAWGLIIALVAWITDFGRGGRAPEPERPREGRAGPR